MTTEPEWLDIARNDLGSTESLGPNDSPLIRKALAKLNGLWLKGQPWCGSIMAYWMQQCAIPYPKDYYRAKAWATWGVGLPQTTPGAIVVFEREGGGHVGIVVGKNAAGNLLVLGGNQKDSVRVSAFDLKKRPALAFRWPPGKSIPLAQPLPVLDSDGELSRNEA